MPCGSGGTGRAALVQGDLLGPQRVHPVAPQDPLRVGGVEEVGRADEGRDERRRRLLVDLLRRAELLDPALVEDGDPVAQGERLFLVVRDEDEGDADLALQLLELDLHLLSQLEVEGAEGLVEQQGLRLDDGRAGEGDALALAAGELRRPAIRERLEAHAGERLECALRTCLLRHPADAQAVGDVLDHGHVGEERVVLKDGVDVAIEGRALRDVVTEQLDRAGGGLLEPGDEAQHRGLTGARRPEHGEELARADVEVQAVDCVHLAEGLGEPGQPDRGSLIAHG